VKFLGIDPSALPVEIANGGNPHVACVLNEETAERIVEQHGQANAISAAGCFATIADLAGVMRGVRLPAQARGIFVTDNSIGGMVQRTHYDNVSISIWKYSLKPLIRLFARRYGMSSTWTMEVYGDQSGCLVATGERIASSRLARSDRFGREGGFVRSLDVERFAAAVAEKRQAV